MKRSNLNKLINLAVLTTTMFLSVAGSAQESGTQYKASVPFQFQIAGKVLPAGDYTVKLTDHFIQIRSTDGINAVGIATLRAERKQTVEKDVLEFNVYGDRYVLSQLWFEGSELGREVVATKSEREVARQSHEGQVELALKK